MVRLLVSAVLLAGCTLSTTRYEECTLDVECQDAFGWGHACGEEGLCQVVEQHPRCSETTPPDLFDNRELYQDLIVVGVLIEKAQLGLEADAATLAVDQANDGEGLDGQLYGVIECTNEENVKFDNEDWEGATRLMADYLARQVGVPAIVGPATSTNTEAAYQVAHNFDTLVISPSATSPSLTAEDGLTCSDADPGLLWRTAPPDDLQGLAMAQDMIKRGISDVAVVYESGSYGSGLQAAFSENFTGNGREVQLLEYEAGNGSQRDAAIADAATGGHEEVVFISGDKYDIIAFLLGAEASQAFFDEDTEEALINIFLADGAYDASIFEDARDARDLFPQVRGTRPTSEKGEIYNTFAAAFKSRTGGDATSSAYTAYSYDASWLVLYGTAWAHYQEGEITGTGIARGLRRVSKGSEVVIESTSWSTVRASFGSGSGIDVIGASGKLDYDETTCETSAPIEVWTVEWTGASVEFDEDTTYDPDEL